MGHIHILLCNGQLGTEATVGGCVKKEGWVFTREPVSAGQAKVGFALDVEWIPVGRQVGDWEEF